MIATRRRITAAGAVLLALAGLLSIGIKVDPAAGQGKGQGKGNTITPPATLIKDVKVPPGYEATIFASPPEVNYPTCLACAPTGEVFVGVDLNSSLDAKPDRGKILRLVDTKGTGKADQITLFAKVDSPRGLAYDNKTLYVLHPPFLTAFYDDKGEGVSNRSEVLVKGIGFDLKFRGADHTTNGVRMGIDGWLYVAVGDYGFRKAVGKDGKELEMRGGGVVRVRPDGTELEIVGRGTRNIYDVAIDPFMNIFTRDNTNDGDGWDVHLSHITPLAQMGYPSLFVHFGDEAIPPLADYGGGAPTGSFYLDEPGFTPEIGRSLLTCEWGRSIVYRHPTKANGASFTVEQTPFIHIPRPTGIAVDGESRLYVASWRGAQYNFIGPDVGYVARITNPAAKVEKFPDLSKASDAELAEHMASASHTRRLHTQQEILRRGAKPALVQGLEKLAQSNAKLECRVAAIFTFNQLLGAASNNFLFGLLKDDAVREFALRALADRLANAAALPLEPFQRALTDADPRVRMQAVIALARIGKKEAAKGLIARTGDTDPVIAHTAFKALVSLGATEACLAELGRTGTTHSLACVLVLQSFHDKNVVDGLLELHDRATDAKQKAAIFRGLCRLYYREADWDGKWWNTRPDTSGPYYKQVKWAESERIGEALKNSLASADNKTLVYVLTELVRHKIDIPGINNRLTALAKEDPAFRPAAAEMLIVKGKVTKDGIALLEEVARTSTVDAGVRAKLLRALWHDSNKGTKGLEAALRVIAELGDAASLPLALAELRREFATDYAHADKVAVFVKAADGDDAGQRQLASLVLLNLGGNKSAAKKTTDATKGVVQRALADPDRAVPMLKMIGETGAEAFAEQVKGLLKSERAEVRLAAADTAKLLGLDRPAAERMDVVSKVKYEDFLAKAIDEKGDAELGGRLFLKQNCIACHTVSKSEPPKGPFLGDVTTRYKRAEIIESILKPSAKIAQGFETHVLTMDDGKILTGFIVREGGDEIEIRDTAGGSTVVKKQAIDDRRQSKTSVMPEGLVDSLTVHEVSSIVAYLESLNRK